MDSSFGREIGRSMACFGCTMVFLFFGLGAGLGALAVWLLR